MNKSWPLKFFFCILYLFVLNIVFQNKLSAQDNVDEKDLKEKKVKEKLKLSAIRAGVDVSQIGYSLFKKGFSSNSVYVDAMLNNSHFLVAEFGITKISRENLDIDGFSDPAGKFNYDLSGQYYRFGIDINTIKNKTDDDAVILGLRYAFTSFENSLSYSGTDDYYSDFNRSINRSGLKGSWLELVSGVKLHFFENFYLATTLRIKIRTSVSTPSELEVSEIPGFGINKSSVFTVNYHILYRIPFKSKNKSEN